MRWSIQERIMIDYVYLFQNLLQEHPQKGPSRISRRLRFQCCSPERKWHCLALTGTFHSGHARTASETVSNVMDLFSDREKFVLQILLRGGVKRDFLRHCNFTTAAYVPLKRPSPQFRAETIPCVWLQFEKLKSNAYKQTNKNSIIQLLIYWFFVYHFYQN